MEDTIKFCIKWYPTLFEGINAREKALTNIFFTIGGDYDWDVDGRRSVLFEYFITDKTMMKYLFDEYNSDYKKNERKQELKSLEKNIKNEIEYLISELPTDIDDEIIKVFNSIENYESNKYFENKDKYIELFKNYDKIYNSYSYKYLIKDIDEYNNLNKFDKNFDPFYHKFMPTLDSYLRDPIIKYPSSLFSLNADEIINDIPDNAQKDYIEGLYEITDFYCQSKFKSEKLYKEFLKLRDLLKSKYDYL